MHVIFVFWTPIPSELTQLPRNSHSVLNKRHFFRFNFKFAERKRSKGDCKSVRCSNDELNTVVSSMKAKQHFRSLMTITIRRLKVSGELQQPIVKHQPKLTSVDDKCGFITILIPSFHLEEGITQNQCWTLLRTIFGVRNRILVLICDRIQYLEINCYSQSSRATLVVFLWYNNQICCPLWNIQFHYISGYHFINHVRSFGMACHTPTTWLPLRIPVVLPSMPATTLGRPAFRALPFNIPVLIEPAPTVACHRISRSHADVRINHHRLTHADVLTAVWQWSAFPGILWSRSATANTIGLALALLCMHNASRPASRIGVALSGTYRRLSSPHNRTYTIVRHGVAIPVGMSWSNVWSCLSGLVHWHSTSQLQQTLNYVAAKYVQSTVQVWFPYPQNPVIARHSQMWSGILRAQSSATMACLFARNTAMNTTATRWLAHCSFLMMLPTLKGLAILDATTF